MRLLLAWVLASLLTVALSYQSGKEYLYKLEGYAYSGLRNTKPQYAGTASIADVIVQVKDNEYTIKINDIKFDVVNDVFTGPFEKYPFDFKEVASFSDLISKPFKAIIEHGLVQKFFIPEDEPDWSVNLKKSFLNLLQLCIGHKRDHQHHEDTSNKNHDHDSDESENYYTQSEKGSFGECDTTYQIKSEQTVAGATKVFNVTKIRNYDKCKKRAHHFAYMSSPYIYCDDCIMAKTKSVWQSGAVYDYNVRGSRDDYEIEKVIQREFETSAPYGPDGKTVEFRTRRILELVEVKDISQTLVVAGNVNPETDLTAIPLKKNEFFDKIDLRKAHYLHDIYRYQAPVNQLVSLFDEVVDDYAKSTDANSANCNLPAKFGEIVDAMSTLDHDEVEQVHKSVWEKGNHHRKLFIDALAASGTNPAFVFAKSLIEGKKLGPYPSQKLLQKLALNIKEPSEALFNEYLQLCTGNVAKENDRLKKACYLTFSGLVGRECVHDHKIRLAKAHQHHHHSKKDAKGDDHLNHYCNPEVADKYLKLLVKPENNEKTDKELNLLIRTASNFKGKESVEYLKKIVDGNYHHHLRAIAASGLIGISKLRPEVVPAMAPHFFDKNEENDIRIAAFISMVWGGSHTELQLIAKHLLTEKNRQIVNFVYSTVEHLLESKLPCQKLAKLRRDLSSIKWIFKIAYDKHGGKIKFGDSRHHIHQTYNDKYSIGASRQFSMVASNRSYIPSSLYFNYHDLLGPFAYDTFGVHIQTYGLEKVINKLLGFKGTAWRKPSFFDIFKRRSTRDASAVDAEIKKIEKALSIEPRDYEEVHVDIAVKMRGYQIWYTELHEDIFASVIKDGSISIPDIQKKLQDDLGSYELSGFIQPYDNLWVIRNEMGVPFFYQLRSLSRLKFENNKFSLNILPSLFSEDRDNKPPTEIQMSIDAKYRRQTESYFTAGLILPVVHRKAGVGYHRRTVVNIPLLNDYTYKPQEKKITFKKTPRATELFYDKLTPFSFLDSYSNKVPVDKEAAFKPIYKENELKKTERNYFKNYFGYGLGVKLAMTEYDKAEVHKFYDEHSFRERLDIYRNQPKGLPYEIKVNLGPADDKPTTEFKGSITWKDAEEESDASDFSYNEDTAFKDYTSGRKDRKPETHVIRVEVNGEGKLPRNIYADLRYSHSKDRLYHKINFNYDRSPINDNGYKICSVTTMKFPEYDMAKFVQLNTLEMDHTVNISSKIAFGENCESQAKITLKAQASQTDEQRMMERSRETISDESPNPLAKKYLYCKNGYAMKYDIFPYCPAYLADITKMRHLVASIDYENIPEGFANATMKLFRSRSKKHYYNADFKYDHESGSPGHIQYESTASAVKPIVDMRVKTPHFTVIYDSVPYPKVPPITTFPLYDYRYWQSFWDVEKQPYCVVQDKLVRTFDNTSYPLPAIDDKCETLVAKDCSPEQVFMVLASKTKDKVALKVFLSNKFKVELIPSGKDIAVHILGKKVPVTKSEPYIQTMKVGNREVELFEVSFNGAYYQITAPKFGVKVASDGIGYGLEVHRYFTGKICGICGDNNKDGNNEWRAANGKVYKNINAFVYSYIVPDSDCKRPEVANENELV